MRKDEKIPYYEDYDFGSIITLTFDFIGQNIRMLSRIFFRIALPMLTLGYLVAFYSIYRIVVENGNHDSRYFVVAIGALLFAAGMALYYFAVLYFMKRYDRADDPDEIKLGDIWTDVSKNIFRMLGVIILTMLIVGVSWMFFAIPGIILFVFLSLALPALVFEDLSVSNALSQSFKLVGGNWWRTFFLIFILSLIQFIFNYLADAPVYLAKAFGLISFSGSLFSLNQTDSISTWIMTSIYFYIQYLILAVLGIIGVIGISFQYFSIRERKEKTGLLRQIESFGKHKEEEYEF